MNYLPLIVALLGAGGVGAVIKALADYKNTRAKDGNDATISLVAAAREMLDPLRKELAQERIDHKAEIEAERRKVAEVRRELEACRVEARELRNELAMARVEADELRRAREQDRAKIRVLEGMLRRGKQ